MINKVYNDYGLLEEIDHYYLDLYDFEQILTNISKFHWVDALYLKMT